MGAHNGRWMVISAAVVCAVFGVASGGMVVIPQTIMMCMNDTLMTGSVQERKDDNGQMMFSGYVNSPIDIDDKLMVVIQVHMPEGDSFSEDAMVLNMNDPCASLSDSFPDLAEHLTSMFDAKPKCPAPKGNYTFTDKSFILPFENPMMGPGKYKVHWECFLGDEKASCAEMVFEYAEKGK